MKQTAKLLVLGALLGGLTACGSDDGPSGPTNQLSEAEVEEVMQAAFEALTVAMGSSFRPMGPGMDRIASAIPIEATGECPLGGGVDVSGDINDNINDEGTGKMEMNMTVSWLDCVVQTSKRKLTLGGGYDVDAEFNYDQWEVVGDARFEIDGSFTWKGPGANGTCPFKALYLYDESAQKITVSGNTCGRTISFSSDDWS